jgi:DNA-3-methyladenine glycosylase
MHHCMNVVTEPEGHGAAVLLRALEPMRNLDRSSSGPGLLCRAMDISLEHNAMDLLGPELFILEPENAETVKVVKRPRVGVDYAGRWARRHLRFYIAGNRFISRP